jgi:tetratricopeptide (TPR) repeat protein
MNAQMRRSAVVLTLTGFALVALGAQVPSRGGGQVPPPVRPQPSAPALAQPPSALAEEAALRIADVYEELGEFAKAEEQFVVAARSSDSKLRESGLAGLRRVRAKARRDADEAALATAKEYERLGRWEQARNEYAAAVKVTTDSARQAAIDGLRRVDAELWWDRARAATDSWLVWLGKGAAGAAAALLFVLWLPTAWSWIKTSRASIKVFPFIGPNDEAGKEVLFWLAYARSKLRAQPVPPPGAVLMAAASSLPYIDLPYLPPEVTEIANLDFGVGKVGLRDALQVVALPKTRVSGGWVPGVGGRVYAELERRHWLKYRFHSRLSRSVNAASQASDLELFGYDVLIQVIEAHGR